MKLYSFTITGHVDDLKTLDVHLDADLELADAGMQGVVLNILPAHLRKVATDLEQQNDREVTP